VSRRQVERRLREVGQRLSQLRDELRIADEQLIPLTEAADDARLRALVSETPVAEREHREAARHAESMRSHRATVAAEIDRLEKTQDEPAAVEPFAGPPGGVAASSFPSVPDRPLLKRGRRLLWPLAW
jgi:DNA repair exonuclease SbcCD ATPase subunit